MFKHQSDGENFNNSFQWKDIVALMNCALRLLRDYHVFHGANDASSMFSAVESLYEQPFAKSVSSFKVRHQTDEMLIVKLVSIFV
jgi:hypothetical protein